MTVYELLAEDIARNTRSMDRWIRDRNEKSDVLADTMIAAYVKDNKALQLALDNLPVEVAEMEVK